MIEITIPPTYPPGCKIVFVGEAGGREEEEAREGWVGPAGRCLQRAAKVADIDWETVGKSNIAKRRPPSNDFRKEFYEAVEEPIYTKTGKLSKKVKKIIRPTQEYSEWVDLLVSELGATNPNLIVATGNEALEAITGLKGITNYRGSIVPSKFRRPDGTPFKVLAIEHPSYIIRGQWLEYWILCYDLKKAKRQMEFPEIRVEPQEVISDPQLDIGSVLANLAYLATCLETKFTLDIETRANYIACFAIAYRALEGPWFSFCVPIQTTSGPYWKPEEESQIWLELREVMKANPNLCNQNIMYDLYYLIRDYGCEPSGVYMDSMLAHSLLYPEFPKGLDFLASFYLDDAVYWKSEGRTWGSKTPDQQLWAYCCKDAIATLRIVEKIDEELKRRNLYNFYHGA